MPGEAAWRHAGLHLVVTATRRLASKARASAAKRSTSDVRAACAWDRYARARESIAAAAAGREAPTCTSVRVKWHTGLRGLERSRLVMWMRTFCFLVKRGELLDPLARGNKGRRRRPLRQGLIHFRSRLVLRT